MSFSSEKSCLQTLNVGTAAAMVAKPILPLAQWPVLPAAIAAASQLLLCMWMVLLKLHSKQIVCDHFISYMLLADVSPTVGTPSNSHCVPSGEAADTLQHGPTALPIVKEEPVIQAQIRRSEYSEFEGLFSIYNPMSSPTWNGPTSSCWRWQPFSVASSHSRKCPFWSAKLLSISWCWIIRISKPNLVRTQRGTRTLSEHDSKSMNSPSRRSYPWDATCRTA